MGFFDLFKSKDKKQQEEQEKAMEYEEGLSENIQEYKEEEDAVTEREQEEEKRQKNGDNKIQDNSGTYDNPKENFKELLIEELDRGKDKQLHKTETVEEIVKEVAKEIKEETQEFIDDEVVDRIIHEVEEIEEEIAEEVLEEITESVEEIVKEVAEEIKLETERKVEEQVVDKVVFEVTNIENEIKDNVNKLKHGDKEKQQKVLSATDNKSEQEYIPGLDKGEQQEKIEEIVIKRNEAEQEPTKKGFFAKLLEGLDKTRRNIMGSVDAVLGGFTRIDEDLFEELEEVLIMADIGVETTTGIIDNLRKRVKKERTTDPSGIKGMLIDEITEILNDSNDDDYELASPTVVLVIGVNGVGKTTTIGKLSSNLKQQNKKVLLAAADTFRAAAIDQLQIWGDRAGLDVIKHEENSDPAAVVFDAVNAAKNRKCDVLICDTAGRLHNKKNLMEELKKISKVIAREYPEANKEVYLVLDATTGQNAMQQAKLFREVADISGIILTKLDGTAKGGIVIAIKSELKIPVRYIGVGEGIHDLQKFNAKDFARALFGEEQH